MNLQLGGKQKGFAIVSAIDYDRLNKYSWFQSKLGYVAGTVDGKTMKIHRFIMSAQKRSYS